MYKTTFNVTGSGYFPLDMLRYDRCFPDGVDSVTKIGEQTLGMDEVEGITIGKYHALKSQPQITVDRWASFGWYVTPGTMQTWKL